MISTSGLVERLKKQLEGDFAGLQRVREFVFVVKQGYFLSGFTVETKPQTLQLWRWLHPLFDTKPFLHLLYAEETSSWAFNSADGMLDDAAFLELSDKTAALLSECGAKCDPMTHWLHAWRIRKALREHPDAQITHMNGLILKGEWDQLASHYAGLLGSEGFREKRYGKSLRFVRTALEEPQRGKRQIESYCEEKAASLGIDRKSTV